MLKPEFIYLASRSPRRAELLLQIGMRFEVLPADVDETVLLDERPEQYVRRLAREKALAGLQKLSQQGLPLHPVLAADTTVCVEAMILGKPVNEADAVAMLRQLSGRWHTVHTAIALARDGRVETALSSTRVELSLLAEARIADYVASGEPHDKAGAYGIQGLAGTFIRRIEGSYSGVMGLPLYETAQLLESM